MRISKTFQSFLPGIFLLGFNIGTGSVTAMAKAGATYGMSLLWTILLSCLVTYFMIVVYGRYTLITGETALYAFRKHIHPALPKGISAVYFAIFFIVLVYAIFWKGKTQFFQRALVVIVAIMSASFIINFFILMPPASDMLKGMIPNIPVVPLDQGKGPFLVIASMVGTTVASCIFIVRTTLVKEAGWTIKDLNIQRRDASAAALMMFIISATIMAASAGTLYFKGLGLSKASQMVELLEPLAGRFAVSIFVTGIVAAGLSSQFPNVLLLPWLICDYNQSTRDMTLLRYRSMVLVISLLGLIVPLFKVPPVAVMIASQAFGAIILPLTVLCIFYLGNKRSIVGDHTYNFSTNFILIIILAFAIYMSTSGIKGIIRAVF